MNFVVHPDDSGTQRTEADVLAVRFPYRRELDMEDHEVFKATDRLINVIIAEVKKGECKLNEALINPEQGNMQIVLSALGIFPSYKIDKVVQTLHKNGRFRDCRFNVRLFAIGRSKNDDLADAVQLTYEDDVLPFIYKRFSEYIRHKRDHQQWDETGIGLYNLARANNNKEDFIKEVALSKLGILEIVNSFKSKL